jgi:ribosomal protein S18 acetylase RimI-like enzyme
MNAAFAHPRIKKAEKIYIDVYEENTRAFNFYYNYGFRVVGKVEVLIEGQPIGFDLVMMKCAQGCM